MYQVYEFFHPLGLCHTNIKGVAEFKKKTDAITFCTLHPFRAVVIKAHTSETIFNNGKSAAIEK